MAVRITPDTPHMAGYAIPVVFHLVRPSERQAAVAVMNHLETYLADVVGGSDIDSWTMPENLDVAEQDAPNGTVVWGEECAFIVEVLDQYLGVSAPLGMPTMNQITMASVLRERLSMFTDTSRA